MRQERPAFKTAVLFWRHALYADVEYVLSPMPVYLEDQLLPWCYSKPVGL